MFSKNWPSMWMVELMNLGYFSYYLMIISFPILLITKTPERFKTDFFLVITSFLIYYLLFIMIPVAGPQFFFPSYLGKASDGLFFQKLIAWIQETGEAGKGARFEITIPAGEYRFGRQTPVG